MKNIFPFLLFVYFICHSCGQNFSGKVAQIEYADTLHGVVIPDPYKWMEDINSPKVLKFVRAENKKTAKAIKKLKKLHQDFFKEVQMRQIISSPDEELFDKPDGNYLYCTRYNETSTLHYIKKRDGSGMEKLLLDEKEALAEKKDFEIYKYELSPDKQLLAYSTFNEHTDECILYSKNIESNTYNEEIRCDAMNFVWDFAWINDSTIIYKSEDYRFVYNGKIYIHKLGTPQSTDRLIYKEHDELYGVNFELSESGKYIFINIFNNWVFETHYLEMDNLSELKIITPREKGHQYKVYHDVGDTVFYIRTNLNAPNFKIVTANISNPESKHWIDFIPESDNLIVSVKSAGNHFVLSEYGNGSMKLTLVDKQSGIRHPIEFDEKVYTTELVHIDTLKKIIRFKYFSYITPYTYYDFDFGTKQLTKIFETQVNNYQKDDYVVEYKTIPSGDGYQIPVTIIYNKNNTRDGTSPVQMGVYGAYGTEVVPDFFDLETLTFLDRGFYLVYPDVRGGGGTTSKRHGDGTVFQRKNTAYDMIAVAQFLINEKYTSAGKIHLSGRSAGGLALGMAVNMHSELFGSLSFIASKLDVLFDKDLPLEWQENGNPNIKEEFEYMLDYSPYQNVQKQAYPAMQFMTGLNDINTPAYQTFKMVAKLRANQTGTAPVFLSCDLEGSHNSLNFKLMVHPYIFKLAIHNNILP